MLKVYVTPPAHLSKAMFRVARALARHVPDNVTVVRDPKTADLHVLHVIAADAIPYVAERPNLEYAVVQYCYQTAGVGDWNSLWERARTVWSYYDLNSIISEGVDFYHAPLGIDAAFLEVETPSPSRDIGAMTSGYVTGPGAEAIEEVAIAAFRSGLSVVHLGPDPVGMSRPIGDWRNVHEISDSQLATFYRSTRWVSGLRHVEGFELPVVEGLACGARPIVFDREDMRFWYDGHAVFVPECHGEELVDHLTNVMNEQPSPVSVQERAEVLQRFDWEPIVRGFWERVL